MDVYYTPKARITGPQNLCLGIIIHQLSFLKKKDGWQGRQEKKEGNSSSTFAALASILPVETQWGAYGIMQKAWRVWEPHSKIGKAG
jgi:hypothetical protein